MKAVVYERFGGPGVLKMTDVPVPEPGRGELLVRVRAASMNPIDWKTRAGKFVPLSGRKFPKRSGLDFSGVIEACGPGIIGLRPGDEVLGLTIRFSPLHGSFAEKCIARAEHVLRKPSRLTDTEAAALPIAGLSALQALRHCGVGAGTKVMIVGASGGLGTFAIQIAKAQGAHVTAVCSPPGIDVCRQLGADIVIDRTQDDPLASPGLFDAILDFASAQTFRRYRHLLTSDGIYLDSNPGPGVFWSQAWTRVLSSKKAKVLIMKPTAGDLKELGTLVAHGSLRPQVGRTFAFGEEEVREMHRLAEAGHLVGKFAVEMPV